MDHLDLWDPKAIKESKGLKVKREVLDMVSQANLDPKENQVKGAMLAYPVDRVKRVKLARKASRGLSVLLETQDLLD